MFKQKKTIETLNYRGLAVFLIAVLAIALSMSIFVKADPTGATVSYQSNTSKNASAADSRTDNKGTITTVNLDAQQQNLKWKAYVGNVTSTFVLDDEDDYSIFQWTIDSFTGQIYIGRNSSVDWSNITCATIPQKQSEDTELGHTITSTDSVNSTFVTQGHKSFTIGTDPINQNACFAAATYANDTAQTASATTPFTEVVLWDGTNSMMLYTTFVLDDASSYRDDTDGTDALGSNHTYDFQAIVPETGNPSDPALTYFFYIELSSS